MHIVGGEGVAVIVLPDLGAWLELEKKGKPFWRGGCREGLWNGEERGGSHKGKGEGWKAADASGRQRLWAGR